MSKIIRKYVVYLYTCIGCNAQYVGSTIRQLHCRINEHIGVSIRTNTPQINPSFSAIRDHLSDTNHSFHKSHIKIMGSTNKSDLRILEAIT